MKALAVLSGGTQRLASIEQFCAGTFEDNAQRKSLRIVVTLVSAVKLSE